MSTGFIDSLDDRVLVLREAENWEEAVRTTGNLLLATGCIEERYIEKMLSTCKELGPYIAIAPGVAIPHARPEDGAKKVCTALVIVKKGVNFGSHNDPVHVLIAFSTPDKQSHIKVLQDLATLLTEKGYELVEKLKKCESEKDALDVLKKLLSSPSRDEISFL